jgi:hypothetical protein
MVDLNKKLLKLCKSFIRVVQETSLHTIYHFVTEVEEKCIFHFDKFDSKTFFLIIIIIIYYKNLNYKNK